MKKQYSRFLKIHGIILLCLGIIMTVQTILGRYKGIGALSFIEGDSLRSVGLFEAYLLAAFSGTVFILLSGKHYAKEWHLLAATAHLILFTTNLLFWEAYALAGIVTIGYISTIAHAIFISLESACYLLLIKKQSS
jgi:hypothetical protein